jgi:hypothetical protein
MLCHVQNMSSGDLRLYLTLLQRSLQQVKLQPKPFNQYFECISKFTESGERPINYMHICQCGVLV